MNHQDEMSDPDYSGILYECIRGTFRQIFGIIRRDPALLKPAVRMFSAQRRASSRRAALAREGIQVPAVLMISPTHRCNLSCIGCYMQHLHQNPASEMSRDQLITLAGECQDLGISFLVFAGGEPLIRKDDILLLAEKIPDIPIAVFTNGLMIDADLAAKFSRRKNLIPIMSMEGDKEKTDARRSEGVFASVLHACSLLRDKRVFFGCSITVTRSNFTEVTGSSFIDQMIQSGCRLFVYVAYVPFADGTRDQVLTDLHHQNLNRFIETFSDRYPAVSIGFPGDEDRFGGCLSAGRGFLHVSPSGDLEPCPAAPLSDANITRTSLRDALKSEFLARIRSNHSMLTESGGGCALWVHREWAESVLMQSSEILSCTHQKD